MIYHRRFIGRRLIWFKYIDEVGETDQQSNASLDRSRFSDMINRLTDALATHNNSSLSSKQTALVLNLSASRLGIVVKYSKPAINVLITSLNQLLTINDNNHFSQQQASGGSCQWKNLKTHTKQPRAVLNGIVHGLVVICMVCVWCVTKWSRLLSLSSPQNKSNPSAPLPYLKHFTVQYLPQYIVL